MSDGTVCRSLCLMQSEDEMRRRGNPMLVGTVRYSVSPAPWLPCWPQSAQPICHVK
jgi:hypothetical protein